MSKPNLILDESHHIGRPNPNDVIKFIDEKYPQYKGTCIYDSKNKCLMTKEPKRVEFHFDAIHGVVRIMGYGFILHKYD